MDFFHFKIVRDMSLLFEVVMLVALFEMAELVALFQMGWL